MLNLFGKIREKGVGKLFNWCKGLLSNSNCAICKKSAKGGTRYYNERSERVKVCSKCVPYAERRAYRKV